MIVIFSTDNLSLEKVGCLNAYLDFHFVLKDAKGRSYPEDRDAWQKAADTMTQQDSQGPCVERHIYALYVARAARQNATSAIDADPRKRSLISTVRTASAVHARPRERSCVSGVRLRELASA